MLFKPDVVNYPFCIYLHPCFTVKKRAHWAKDQRVVPRGHGGFRDRHQEGQLDSETCGGAGDRPGSCYLVKQCAGSKRINK